MTTNLRNRMVSELTEKKRKYLYFEYSIAELNGPKCDLI